MDTPAQPKKPVFENWHPADIVAALRKKGWSLRKLSIANDYQPGTLKVALLRQWPKAQKIIAEAIGVPATEIWPTRYTVDGNPVRHRPGKKPRQ